MVEESKKWDKMIDDYKGGPTMVFGYNPSDGKPPYIGQRLEDLCGHRGRVIAFKRNVNLIKSEVPQYVIEVGYITKLEEATPHGRSRKVRRIA